ncbi:MAG: mandelate racemase/muconate lactonizing enzyme family protein [candidate division Zixibacteria bacterium]|nr:mandelate racemase/muconate lactonizing enzyme family protein [candidate division Zixibacteria bacterium]
MKIVCMERIVVCVPFRPGILPPIEQQDINALYPEPIEKRRNDILRVYTDDGLCGIGSSGPYFGERDIPFPDLLGKNPMDFEPRSLGGGGYDIALLDLIGKGIGWPLGRIFGGIRQSRVLVDYWIATLDVESSATAARRASALGFHGIKIKCRAEDGNVADRVHAIHEAAPALRIIIDPNERFYMVEQSLEIARQINTYTVVFEDPMAKTNWADYRRLKEESGVLIAAHLQNPFQVIEGVYFQAVDAINVAPSDWGFLDMARIAETADIPVWQASNVDLGIFDVFRLHASAAAPNCTLGSDLCGNFVHENSLLKKPLVRDGYAVVPEGPGLGVELDEAALDRYTLSRYITP